MPISRLHLTLRSAQHTALNGVHSVFLNFLHRLTSNVDFYRFPVHNKKKTCPVCEKNISSNAIKRHYQAKHAKDSRKALFCPKCAHVDWRGDCTILEHMENKHGISIERKRNNTSKGKATKSDSSEDDSEEAEEAEGHEEDEEIDGEEMIDMAP